MDENHRDRLVKWQTLLVPGLGPIERVVAVFTIGPPLERLPFASFKVKVIERADGSLFGVPNVAVRTADGTPDWIGGFGKTVDEALAECLTYFLGTVDDRAKADLFEEDFEGQTPLSSEANL